MSTKARYVGHPDGIYLTIEFPDGDRHTLHVPHGGELPAEVRGRKVPASFRDSLLEQEANWTEVKRDTGSSSTKKDGEK